jgi:hypothetical protein
MTTTDRGNAAWFLFFMNTFASVRFAFHFTGNRAFRHPAALACAIVRYGFCCAWWGESSWFVAKTYLPRVMARCKFLFSRVEMAAQPA